MGRICCLFPWFKLHASGVSVHFITLGIRALRHVDWLILTTPWEEAILTTSSFSRQTLVDWLILTTLREEAILTTSSFSRQTLVDWLILTTLWEEANPGRHAHFREKYLKRDTIQTGSDGHNETKSVN